MCDVYHGMDLAHSSENPEFILCVMWETSVLVGQLLALQEGLDDHGIID
jgi:hypothetical protein